jgi:lambda family phage portal protein
MKPSILDRAWLALRPQNAAKRIRARMLARELLSLEASSSPALSPFRVYGTDSRWRGASQTLRSMQAWRVPPGSGRMDNSKPERDRAGARSFDAYRNHLIARAAIGRVRTNVVGTGLTMHPDVDADVLGLTELEAEDLNAVIYREWALYYDNPTEVDIEATLDGAGLQSLALVTALLAGDAWASTPFEERPGGQYGTKIQLIDPARVCNPDGLPNDDTLVDGVVLSNTGAPLSIQVCSRHPAEPGIHTWETRPIFAPSGARRIFQIWNDKDRIGTTRGMSYIAPILEPLLQLEQYSRAELTAAVISSMFTVFIEKDSQQFDERGEPIPWASTDSNNPTPSKGVASDLALSSGAILDLNRGEKASFANPTRPNANYDPFFVSIVRQIGAAIEVPIDELLLNYQASYSAARAAMLQAWRFYSMRRWWLVQQFCAPHYRLWFDEAVARGRIPVVDYADPQRRAAYHAAIWIGPARGAMQEADEVTAARARVEAGFSNETIETAQMMGENWSSVYRQRRRELTRRRTDGTMLTPQPGAQSPGNQQSSAPAPAGPPTRAPSDRPSETDPAPETEPVEP